MVFSSITFLYYFLPVILIAYYVVKRPYRNIMLLLGSLFFYAFGEPIYVLLLIFSSVVDYIHGLKIEKYRGTKKAKAFLISSIIINVSLLAFFKYADFMIVNINTFLDLNMKTLGVRLPIGISFYTFQTMSYTIDVYRGKVQVQKNLLKLSTYITLFPQLIAGPIVRYKELSEQLDDRKCSFDTFSYGVQRFVIGLSKKVLLANTLGELCVQIGNANNETVLLYWIGAIAFTLQIYFDFSGYSDMAIGLGRLFGFTFLENFNYPFVAKSITDFWRRWHISLGSWFKDYVYIPLGGNRKTPLKWLRNILIVWLLTGFWHGANWNFMIWGLYFGIFIMMEKLFLIKWLKKVPATISHLYVLFVVVISFVIFKNENMTELLLQLKGMFGLLTVPFTNHETYYYLRSYLVVILVAIVMSTPVVHMIIKKIQNRKSKKVLATIKIGLVLIAMFVVTGYIVDASFNPFLYFRF